MMALLDYPILGKPTISLSQFNAVLIAAHSPMASEAQGVYNAYVAHGVNPAIGLAIAAKESGFGRLGIAVGRDNPYGMRYYAGTPGAVNSKGWAKFSSYTAAANANAALLASSLYGRSTKYNTARTFAYRYAPSSDGNNPAGYGSFVASKLAAWGAVTGIPYHAPAATAAPKSAASHPAVGAVRSHPKAAAAGIGIAGAVVLALIL